MQQKQENISKIKLFTDGGARSNPGDAGIGFVVIAVTPDAEIILKKCGNYIGVATNNQAEYQALEEGIKWLLDADILKPLEIFMDSKLIVNQIQGNFKVKNQELKKHWINAHNLLKRLPSFNISYIPREQNTEADYLVNLALDKKGSIEL